MPRGVLLALAIAGWLLWGSAPAAAQGRPHPFPPAMERHDAMRGPGLRSGPRVPLGSAPRTGYGAYLRQPVESTAQPLFLGVLEFYRTVVSPVNGSNSDLAPVPSLYAVQAIKAHGVLLGTVLTTARLIGEPSVIPLAPPFVEDGRTFHYDPLAWNTYWLPAWLRGE